MNEYFKDPSIILKALGRRQLLNWVPEKKYDELLYKLHEGKKLDLDNPKLLNEKLQWLKIYDHNPLYTELVDKYRVKDYISKKIGEEFIIPTLGIWNNARDIDFNQLPDSFVLKTNHDSHSLVICKDKKNINFNKVISALNKSLKRNGYWYGREWPYKNVQPLIMAERFIQNKDGSPLVDYKFYCYGGKPIYFMVSYGEAEHHVRNHKFDLELNSIDYLFKKEPTVRQEEIILPDNIDQMIYIARQLCEGFQHIRVDLYNVDGKIYFGELTFYSSAGFINIYSKEYSNYLSSLIDIDAIKKDDKTYKH